MKFKNKKLKVEKIKALKLSNKNLGFQDRY